MPASRSSHPIHLHYSKRPDGVTVGLTTRTQSPEHSSSSAPRFASDEEKKAVDSAAAFPGRVSEQQGKRNIETVLKNEEQRLLVCV